MNYKELSAKTLEQIMETIRKENGKSFSSSNLSSAVLDSSIECQSVDGHCNDLKIQRNAQLEDAEAFLDAAIIGTQIGFRHAPMYKKKGISRKIARVVELIYLRIAELSHRDLRSFASSIISAMRILASRIESLFVNDQKLEDRITTLEERTMKLENDCHRDKKLFEDRIMALEDNCRRDKKLFEDRIMALENENQSYKQDSIAKLEDNYSKLIESIEMLQSDINKQLAVSNRSHDLFGQIENVDGFYHVFEETFRGTRDDIANRLEVYRPLLGEIIGSLENKRCIDLGCGRGEMLDFYRNSGVSDRIGVDLNPVQLEICRSNGHEALEEDCVEFLKSQPKCSADMISAIQLVEHLSFSTLIELLDESRRVLRPGGIILIETPNCDNLITATKWFFIDPSHVRPINAEYLRFMAQRSGFADIHIIGVNPAKNAKQFSFVPEENDTMHIINENMAQLNELFYGAQDYALIGVKR